MAFKKNPNQPCESKENIDSPAEYDQIEETLAPEVMKDIAEWINRLH